MKTMNQFITELKKIKREELTERRFYEEVLSTVREFYEVSLTEKDLELLKKTLIEIGCKTPEELKKTTPLYQYIGEARDAGSTEFAESCIEQFFFKSAQTARQMMVEDGWVKQWLEKSHEISSIEEYNKRSPYHKVAKAALMNWNGWSEEKAQNAIEILSVEELDSQVYAKGSMDAAIHYLGRKFGWPEDIVKAFSSIVYQGFNNKNVATRYFIKHQLESRKIVSTYMDVLFAVHDNWVQGNAKKFMAREKKHQHMPSELIGWNEAKADLLFVRPIFEALGIYVSEYSLEEEYKNRVTKYFLENHIEKTEDLEQLIKRGDAFYPALAGQEENLEALRDQEIVKGKVIPQIEEKGIGSVANVRKMIVERVSYTATAEELSYLTTEELKTAIKLVEERLATVPEERRENSRQYQADLIRLNKMQIYAEQRKIQEKNKTENQD